MSSPLHHSGGLTSTFTVVWIVICATILVLAGLDLGPHLIQWLSTTAPTPADLGRSEQIVSACSRFLATTLSMLVALCALALPLTANVYTPRLIELFLADRLNRTVLVFIVVANAIVLWNAFMIGAVDPATARSRALLCVVTTLVSLLTIAPYFLYVLRFLLPQTIVARLGKEVRKDFRSLAKSREGALQQAVTNVQYIGKVTLRSIQRHDRDVAAGGLSALEDLFTAYLEVKSEVPAPGDLPNTTRDALGLSPELAQEVVRKGAVVEVAILQELSLLLPVAIDAGVGEVVSQIATLTRRCGTAVAVRNDDRVEEMITLYFNTFLRSALKSRNSEAFYKICYQYRRFATDLLTLDPPLAERITFFLDYYAHQALRMNLPFLINVVAYDLAALCEEAYQRDLATKVRFLEAFILLDRDLPGILGMAGVVKAQIILAARLRTRGDEEASTQLFNQLQKVPKEVLRETFREIVAARDQEHFWEIGDRRRHLDHVESEFRPAIGTLREMLLGVQTLGNATLLFMDGRQVPGHDESFATSRSEDDAAAAAVQETMVGSARSLEDLAEGAQDDEDPERTLAGESLSAEDLARLTAGAPRPSTTRQPLGSHDMGATMIGMDGGPMSPRAFEESVGAEISEDDEDPEATLDGQSLSAADLAHLSRARAERPEPSSTRNRLHPGDEVDIGATMIGQAYSPMTPEAYAESLRQELAEEEQDTEMTLDGQALSADDLARLSASKAKPPPSR